MSDVTGINFFEEDASIVIPIQESEDREYYIFATDFAEDGPESVVKINTLSEFRDVFGRVINKKVERMVNYALSNGWGVIFKRVTNQNAYVATAIFRKVVQKFEFRIHKTQDILKFDPNTQTFTPATLTLNIDNNTNAIVLRNINLLDNGVESIETITNKFNTKSIINSFKNNNAIARIIEDPQDNDYYLLSIYVLSTPINLQVPVVSAIGATFTTQDGGYVNANTKYYVYGIDNEENYTNFVQYNVNNSSSIVTINASVPPNIDRIVIYKEEGNTLKRITTKSNKFVDYGVYFTDHNTPIEEAYAPTSNFTVSYRILVPSSQNESVSAGNYTYYILLQNTNTNNYSRRYVNTVNFNDPSLVEITLSNLPLNHNFKIYVYRLNNSPSNYKLEVATITISNNSNQQVIIFDSDNSIRLNSIVANYTIVATSNSNPIDIDQYIPDNVYDSVNNLQVVSEVNGGISNISYWYRVVPYKVVNNIKSYGVGVDIAAYAPVLVNNNTYKNILSWTPYNWAGSNITEQGYIIYRYVIDNNGERAQIKKIELKDANIAQFFDYGSADWEQVSTRPQTAVAYITIVLGNTSTYDFDQLYFIKANNVRNTDDFGNVYQWGLTANTTYKTSRYNNLNIKLVDKYNKLSKQHDVSLVLINGEEVPLFSAVKQNNVMYYTFKNNNKTASYNQPEFNDYVEELYYYIFRRARTYYINRNSLDIAFQLFEYSDGKLNLFGGMSGSIGEINTPTTVISNNTAVFENGNSGIPANSTTNNLEKELLNIYVQNNNAVANEVKTELLKTNLYRNLTIIYYPYFFNEYFWDNINNPAYKNNAIQVFNILRDVAETRGDILIITDTPPVSNYGSLATFNQLIGAPDTSYVAVYTPSVINNNKRVPVGLEILEKIIILINTDASNLAPYGISNNGVIEAQAVEKSFTTTEYEQIYDLLNFNPIIDFGSDGILVRGLKTLYKKVSVLQSIHTRLLANIMKKKLYSIAFRYQGANITSTMISSLMFDINLYLNNFVRNNQIVKFDPVKNLSTTTDIMQGKLKLKITVYFTRQLEAIDFFITFEGPGEITVS